jgi:hypothetical protein
MANDTHLYKLFRVKLATGRVTTASLKPALLKRAEAVLGGVAQVSAWIRETALAYEPGPGRTLSTFISSELQMFLGGGDSGSPKAPVHAVAKIEPAKRVPAEVFQREFHELLGRLAHAHANLDFNVGLQLNWLGPYLGVDVRHLLDARKVPFSKRLSKLEPLILDLFENAGEDARAEFRRWFAAADALKALRNDYIHGRWGVPGHVVDGHYMLSFVQLHWDMNPERPDDSVHMSLAEFADQVRHMEMLAGEYFRLERSLLIHAKPSAASTGTPLA